MSKVNFFNARALDILAPEGSKWIMVEDDLDQLDWQDDSFVRPADDIVLAKAVELETEWKNKEYARSRSEEYPDWGTQLDYIYHNGIEKWKTDIVDPVKKKYPKPE
mgnify:FL=1